MQSKGTYRNNKIGSLLIIIATHLLLALFVYSQTPARSDAEIALSEPLTLKWLYESEATISLTPATDGERIYLPLSFGRLVSLSATKGELLWKTDLGGELSSSPIADDYGVYIASETSGQQSDPQRAKGVLRALGREGGITLWARSFPMPLRGALAADKTNIFGGSGDGRVYAVKKKTGDISWVMQYSSPFTANPIVSNGKVYIGSNDGSFFSLNQINGQINWRYRTRGAVNGRAVVFNGLVYFGSADGYVYALRETDGRLRWKHRTGAGVQTVAFARSGLLVASFDNFVYLLSFRSGDRLWKRLLAGRIAAEPLTTSDGALFTPLSSSVGVVLNLRDGKQLNSIPIDGDNSLAASPIIAGKVLLVTTRHGLMAFSRPS